MTVKGLIMEEVVVEAGAKGVTREFEEGIQ